MRRSLFALPLVAGLLALGVPLARTANALPAPAPAPASVVSLTLPGVSATSDADTDALMTAVLADVDGYWTRVFGDNGRAEPRVSYSWIPAGRSVVDGCSGGPTDSSAAFYCPVDDTIYVSQSFAGAVRGGDLQQWPSGDRVRSSLGDMAVAYMVAHEEAHNIQDELGLFDAGIDTPHLELHADCLAGAWAADAAQRGVVNVQDKRVGEVTAWLVGDYAFDSQQHHGTPQERRDAFSAGYDDLASCSSYLQS